jgi:two-component system nitrogen regulation response regulator GlnG
MQGWLNANRSGMEAVWVVDDDQSIRWVLERALQKEGLSVRLFESARACLTALPGGAPRVLVSDIRMPGESGLQLLQQAKAQHPGLPVIIMTAFSDLDSAVSSFQGGAFDYLPKPFDLPKAIALIRRAVEEGEREAAAVESAHETPELLGLAPAMQEVFRAIGRLSQSNVTVLITGESGSGKELIAQALHRHSARASKPFVALNAAAIPKDLLESELFGHERGAFTGAQQMRRGRFEQAEGGTLFLDEIGDMPADLQTRLLRVLSDGHFYRVGGHQPLKANVRVLTATHQNLEERVRQGLFREDLFHRLNVIRLRLPPLRERLEDIGLLARHFLARSALDLGVEPKRLSDDALKGLEAFRWPGNVRQLQNVCQWLTVMAPGQVIEFKDLPPEVLEGILEVPPREGVPMPSPSQAAEPGAFPGLNGSSRSAMDAGSGFAGIGGAYGHGLAPSALPTGGGSVGAGGVAVGMGGGGSVVGVGRAPQGAWPAAALLPSMADGTVLRPAPEAPGPAAWSRALEHEVTRRLLEQSATWSDPPAESLLMDELTREFESVILRTALRHTRGRRIDAALRLGIGRNTITRKIAELRLEED